MRKRFIVAAAAVLSLAIADAASAQSVPLSFDNAVLNTPATPKAVVVSPKTAPITVTASYDPTTGDLTIAPASLHFPAYAFSSPVPGSLQVLLGTPATGHLDASTGQLTLTADFQAQITLQNGGSCTVDTGSQAYSTDMSTVYPGTRFPATATGVVTGPGALTGGWTTVPAGTGSACSLVDAAVSGPGGLWISKGIAPPTPAKLSLSAARVKRTVAAGKPVTFTAIVKNTGGTPASSVTVCIGTPSKRLHVSGHRCKSLSTLTAGASKTAKFTINTTTNANGSYKIQFTSAGKGLTTVKSSSTVKVKAKK